jgi:hypothetical protein
MSDIVYLYNILRHLQFFTKKYIRPNQCIAVSMYKSIHFSTSYVENKANQEQIVAEHVFGKGIDRFDTSFN